MTIIILLFSLIFIGGGVVLKMNAGFIEEQGDKMRKKAKEFVDAAIPDNFPDIYKENEFLPLDIGALINDISVGAIVFGVFFTILCICGFIVACCVKTNKRLYYGIYFIVWLVVGIIYLGLFANSGSFVENKLRDALVDYKGFADVTLEGATWTGIMIFFKCCGPDNYKVFHDLEHWPPTDLNKIEFHPFGKKPQNSKEFQEAAKRLLPPGYPDAANFLSGLSQAELSDPAFANNPEVQKLTQD